MSGGINYEIPESGAVFTFGRSRFADNQPSHFFIRNDNIVNISCGDEHTALICENGRVFVFGSNDYGQLGLGHTKAVSKPSCVKILKPFHSAQVACGKGHTLVATRCGKLFTFGSNSDGQLGLGDTVDRNTPTEVELNLSGSRIKALAAGCFHSALLTEAGDVFTWGCNNDGQCGSNSTECIPIPTKLSLGVPFTTISCGYYHTVIAGVEVVYTMGEADNGKLGRPEGENSSKPEKIDLKEKVSSVICGGSHSIVLTDSGVCYGFGSNFSGQLGTGSVPIVSTPTRIDISRPIIYVGCGESHSAFVTEDGELYTCGDTRHGKLCLDDIEGTSLSAPTLVPILQPYCVTAVSCGGCHTMVVAKLKGDSSDADIVCQIKPTTLPPLKVRNPAEDDNSELLGQQEEESSPVQTDTNKDETPDQEDVETRTVVLSIEGTKEEDEDGKSNTESSINVEEIITSPADDIYSEIREVLSDVEEMNSPQKETNVAETVGDVVKTPSRMQKILRAFKKKKKATPTPIQSPTAEGDDVFINEGGKIGNQHGSKACSIL